MNKSKGFTAVEGLLILIIVGLIGFTGWYAWHAHQNANKTLNTANSVATSSTNTKKTTATDPTADWVVYSSTDGKFSFKYPKTWTPVADPQMCGGSLMLLGGNSKAVGHCGADGPGAAGQMQISSEDGDHSKDLAFPANGYKDIVTVAVTLNGDTGSKQTATASGQSSAAEGFADGTKFTQYIFYDSSTGKTYLASYIDGYRYPDVLADFNTLVTKTWKFSS